MEELMKTDTKEEVKIVDSEELKEQVANTSEKSSKKIRIFGISLWRILAYFIIYSVVGFIVETTYGTVTKGLVESRQSFFT